MANYTLISFLPLTIIICAIASIYFIAKKKNKDVWKYLFYGLLGVSIVINIVSIVFQIIDSTGPEAFGGWAPGQIVISLFSFLLMFVFVIINKKLAVKKNKNPYKHMTLSLFFGVICLIYLLVVSNKTTSTASPKMKNANNTLPAEVIMDGVIISTGGVNKDFDVIDTVFAMDSHKAGFFKGADPNQAFEKVKQILVEKCKALGGNGVLNCQFEYRVAVEEGFTGAKQVIEIFAYGTAVKIQ